MFEEIPELTSSELVVSESDGVLLVEVNRPRVRNAIDQVVTDGLTRAMDHLDATEHLRAAVLTGRGGSFCSGMDLKAYAEEGPPTSVRGAFGMGEVPATKPIVAAVEGWALAGGFELALCCDLIVAGESSQFGLPEVRHGLIAAGGGAIRLPRSIAYHSAAEILLTGDPLPAERLHTLGVVNRVVADGAAMDTAITLARRIAKNNAVAVRASKVVAMRSCGWSGADAWHTHEPEATLALGSAEAKAGARKFVGSE